MQNGLQLRIAILLENKNDIIELWKNEKVQEGNEELLPKILELAKKSGNFNMKNEIFASTKVTNTKMLHKLIELASQYNIIDTYHIWINANSNVQMANSEVLLKMMEEDIKPEIKGELWGKTNDEIQKKFFSKVIGNIDSIGNQNDHLKAILFSKIWKNTNEKVKEENEDLLYEVINQIMDAEYLSDGNFYENTRELILLEICKNSNKEIQKKILLQIVGKYNSDHRFKSWDGTVYYKDYVINEKIDFGRMFGKIDKEVHEETIDEMLETVKENPYIIQKIIRNTDTEVLKERIYKIGTILTGKTEFSEQFKNKLNILSEKNKNVLKTLNWKFLDMAIQEGYTDEQLFRMTNDYEIQELLLKCKDNKIMNAAMNYVLKNDTNWILSLGNKINVNKYTNLLINLSFNTDEQDIDKQFIENFLSVISDTDNYFNIQTADDVKNYINTRNSVCNNILDGDVENIPENLRGYSNANLYKFALLEYKFGISLEEAKFLIERYGKDTEEIYKGNPNREESQYLMALKTIVECDCIEEVIKDLRENDTLDKPWEEIQTARNAEGKIINMYAELYNETLYKPKEEDRTEEQEIYIDQDGKTHSVDVFYINGDFDMNFRVEGAYRNFSEPQNFVEYYDNPDITNHGNCESYIGNDLIAGARNNGGVAVGYNYILSNQLTAAGPTDLGTANNRFSNYRERSEFRTPEQMKNHTRHAHNEMVKERLLIDEHGDVQKYKPSYAVWIEEDTEEDRKQEGWKEKREQDSQWIMTKKLAAQLGIPVVIIDREHFAKREMKKIELMKKLISGEKFDREEYSEFLEQYECMPKPQLIEEMVIKFENNRTGIQFSKLRDNYFSEQQFETMISSINSSIEQSSLEDKKEMYESLLKVSSKEQSETEKYKTRERYSQIIDQTAKAIQEMEDKSKRLLKMLSW